LKRGGILIGIANIVSWMGTWMKIIGKLICNYVQRGIIPRRDKIM
jgi:hypothetical protein